MSVTAFRNTAILDDAIQPLCKYLDDEDVTEVLRKETTFERGYRCCDVIGSAAHQPARSPRGLQER